MQEAGRESSGKASMADVLTPKQRRLNMSRVRGKDTRPEMILRRGLHARGLRFRLHCKDLPGTPDIVFPRHRAAIFVHGCFWHAHGCPMFKLPSTNTEFWDKKLAHNRANDATSIAELHRLGWRVFVVWECALRGPARHPLQLLLDYIIDWLGSQLSSGSISGDWARL